MQTCRAAEPKLAPETQEKTVKRPFRNDRKEDHGNILVCGLSWARGTDCIIDVHTTDVHAKSQRSKDSYKV
jgi:hypothetical protein